MSAENASDYKASPVPHSTHKIAIVLIPEYSDLVLTLIRELPRISQLTNLCRFEIVLCSTDGRPVFASNGHRCEVDLEPAELNRLDAVLVCASYNPMQHIDHRLMSSLRKQFRHGAVIAGVDTGGLLLAEAGLLDGRRATLHWDELQVARLRYPKVDFVGGLVEWDGQFLTSCGSLGTIEFTLEFIARFAGRRVADMVVDLTRRSGCTGQFERPSTPLGKAIQTIRKNI